MPEIRTIKLAQPWTYHTPLVTIDFPAGEHEVSEAIAAAAPAPAPVTETKEEADGDAPPVARKTLRKAAE